MFDEPPDENEDRAAERATDPAARAREKADEFRVHAELFAVFEGTRKFDAEIRPDLNSDLARDLQKRLAALERKRLPEMPILDPEAWPDAAKLLQTPQTSSLSTNDYHLARRPGEVLIFRFLAAAEVDRYYERLQAHLDAALGQFRQEQRSANEWKQDPDTIAYLDALDKVQIDMAQRYLRPQIKQHNLFVLSTQTADEIDILFLSDYVMGADAAILVGPASAPPDDPTEDDRAWFFKLFALRGMVDKEERMCFFAFLQKAEDTFDL